VVDRAELVEDPVAALVAVQAALLAVLVELEV
jgi:hypothetical protein